MLALHRRVIKTLKKHAPGITAECIRETRHVILEFTYDGASSRITMSKSPHDLDNVFKNACTDVCKAFGLPRITH